MKTFGESAKEVLAKRYPHERYVYDHALPVSFVKEMQDLVGFSPAGHFVWLYMEDIYCGKPEPITPAGIAALVKWRVAR